MNLYAASAPAVVHREIVYSSIHLIAFHELSFHVWKRVQVGTVLLLQVQNIRAAEVKIKTRFLNVRVMSFTFSCLLLCLVYVLVHGVSVLQCAHSKISQHKAQCLLSAAWSCPSAFKVAL